MRRLDTRKTSIDQILALLQPAEADLREQRETVRGILERVRAEGDAAVREFSRRFDGAEYEGRPVPPEAFEKAEQSVSREFKQAVDHAVRNIRAFHERQRPRSWLESFDDGTLMGQQIRPLERVGLYVPGGRASYPSSVMMVAVPARVAGVGQVVLCSPPGGLTPQVLFAAQASGVSHIYPIGGAHAIAAMAYGTETVPKVDKICGPGNVYVVLAKREVFGEVGIESLPGPSEVLVIADDSADPDWAAADLLAQAEHGGADHAAPCLLATPSPALADAVLQAVDARLAGLQRREMAAENLERMGLVVVTRDLAEACELCNRVGPEHLQVMTRDPWGLLPLIRNAGAIFLGAFSTVPLGDYIAGPSHVLPTERTARFSSPLSVDDFVKKSTVVYSPEEATRALAGDAIVLAEAEGLTGHAEALRARLRAPSGR